MSNTQPDVPNVVIKNPTARRIGRTVVDVATLILGVTVAVDVASDAFNILAFTSPVAAGLTVLRFAFGQAVDNPNTPKTK